MARPANNDVIIGIDLGTTLTKVSIWKDNQPVVLPIEGQYKSLPSCVLWKKSNGDAPEQKFVGRAAQLEARNVPGTGTIVFDVKRLIGLRFDSPKVQNEIKEQQWPFKLKAGPNNNVMIESSTHMKDGRKKDVAPEDVSAELLMAAKKAAESFLQREVKCAVVTVPANFEMPQRQATRDAAEMAGLKVERMLNEPTAAALAYARGPGAQDARSKTILVYDFGGGTLDVTLMSMSKDRKYQVLATSGNNHLGGINFDRMIFEHIAQLFKDQTGKDLKKGDAGKMEKARLRLLEEARSVKQTLTTEFQAVSQLDSLFGGEDLDVTITRATFENLCQPLFDRCLDPVEDVLRQAKMQPNQVDEVILVGGSSRIPKVRTILTNYFGKPLLETIDPDEAVALGAAVQASNLQKSYEDQGRAGAIEPQVKELTPATLGIEVKGNKASCVIPRGTAIPVSRSEPYITAEDNQTEALINILEGEHKVADDNESLGNFSVSGIPPLPAGKGDIHVNFNIDLDGILSVTAETAGDKKSLQVKAYSSRLPEAYRRARAQENSQAAPPYATSTGSPPPYRAREQSN